MWQAPVVAQHASDGAVRLTVLGQDFLIPRLMCDSIAQVESADEHGVDRRVLMAPPFAALYELPVLAGLEWSQRLNDAIAQEAGGSRGRLDGFANVPLQDGDLAAVELARAAQELHLSGVQILTSVCGSPLDAPELEQFWCAAAELRIPVFIHPHYVSGSRLMTQLHLRNLIGNPTETALAGARLLFSGILNRFPELAVVLAHGGGALAHLIGRLQHGFQTRPEFLDGAASPREGLRKLYYDTVVFDQMALRHLAEIVGDDRMVLGSDYPFDMAEMDPVGFVRGSGMGIQSVERLLHRGSDLLDAANHVSSSEKS